MTLFDIKDYLDSLMQSFAALLELELTVVNAVPIQRVAGTGFYGTTQVNDSDKRWEQSYTRKVIETGQPAMEIDTSPYRINVIPEQERSFFSDYYSVLLYPIRCKERTEGVIIVASFTPMQQQLLISKKDRLMDYLAKTAEMISLKLEQDELQERTENINRQLNLINETVENGMMLYSQKAGVQRMNARAKRFLRIGEDEPSRILLTETLEIANKADELGEKYSREVFRTINNHSYFLTVQALPLNNTAHDVLCLITPFAQVQDAILQNDASQLDSNEIVATSEVMCKLLDRVKTAAWHTSNVLILGESGTGKEMFARMIHANSGRKNNPFVSINCAAIPESLLESELFGYEEGAFTGARRGGRIGKFMLANKGTLFLDEIGDMPLYLQAKLLRVLSERKVDRVGGSAPVDVDVRIVAATNRNLEELIANRQFREDLYYRLSVIPFEIPPLRERKEDIIALVKHFIRKYNEKLNKKIEGISDDALDYLISYSWPGNVRELENCLEYMMNFEQGVRLSFGSMPRKLSHLSAAQPAVAIAGRAAPALAPLKQMLVQYEKMLFADFNASCGGKPSLERIDEFCATLQISRATYYRKCSEIKG